MKTNSRIVLSDFYEQPKQFYHATFDHLSYIHDKSKPITALLKNIYLVDDGDNRLPVNRNTNFLDEDGNSIIADHLWVEFDRNWFYLPQELLSGDEIFFSAEVNQYKIARKDILKQRDKIWKQNQEENKGIYNAWQGVKHNLHGRQYSVRYEQMRAHIQSNNELARIKQNSLPLVDYTLKNLDFEVVYYDERPIERVKYDWNTYKKNPRKYMNYLVRRSKKFQER